MSRLADFIDTHVSAIVDEWVHFAATLPPLSENAPLDALRDHAVEMLARITTDVRLAQTPAQQKLKSEGRSDAALTASAAGRHGAHRQSVGLDVAQMVAEFRALRATVIRLWSASDGAQGPDAFEEVLRFNEAIDQALAESANAFSSKVEHYRQLMMGMVAHDLRGPLNIVNLSARALAREDAHLAQDASMARLMRASARMGALVNDLLDVAGSQLGSRLRIVPAPMDLQRLAQETVDEARAEHPHMDFQLRCDAPMVGEWDAGRLAQLLFNLFRNAVEHGDATQPIRCTIRRDDEGVSIEVQNQGPVIPPLQQSRIFHALVRGGSSEDPRQNLGLGLYICRDIVAGHGGTIRVRSDDTEGTVFAVNLPWRPVSPEV